MARPRKPWYRAGAERWYVVIDGRQEPLGERGPKDETRAGAMLDFHRLMVGRGESGDAAPPRRGRARRATVADVCDLFLVDCLARVAAGELEAATADWYRRHLQSFCDAQGSLDAAGCRPLHVTRWLAGHPDWKRGTRHGAITAVKRAYRWARRQGHLADNPLAELERPGIPRREAVLAPEQYRAIVAATADREFRDLLAALWETGCRPGEVMQLTAADVDLDGAAWRVVDKVRRKTGSRRRVVDLTPAMVALSRELCGRWPAGPIFRNTRGNPWTRHATALRFARLRKQLGFGGEATAYAHRHLYITDALEAGVPVATVAELVGHSGTAMIQRVYSRLGERRQHLRDAARKARPGDGQTA